MFSQGIDGGESLDRLFPCSSASASADLATTLAADCDILPPPAEALYTLPRQQQVSSVKKTNCKQCF